MSVITDGLLAAAPYLCLALSYGLLYGMLGIMDLTVAARFAAAGYAGSIACGVLGWYPPRDGVVMFAAFGGALGISLISWFLIKPLSAYNQLSGMVGSVGIAFVFQSIFQLIFGTAPRVYTSYPVEAGFVIAGTIATPLQLISFVYAVVSIAVTSGILYGAGWGRALQAVAADPEVAATVFGIKRRSLEWQVNMIVALIIAPCAVFYGAAHGVSPGTGVEMSLLAFVSAIVAGRGRPIGAVGVAGFLMIIRSAVIRSPLCDVIIYLSLGLAAYYGIQYSRSMTTKIITVTLATLVAGGIRFVNDQMPTLFPNYVMPSEYQDVAIYAMVSIALLVKPTGLFARPAERIV